MRRKPVIGATLALIIILQGIILVACGNPTAGRPPVITSEAGGLSDAASKPASTATVGSTDTPEPTPTPEATTTPSPTPLPTETPTPTPTPEPMTLAVPADWKDQVVEALARADDALPPGYRWTVAAADDPAAELAAGNAQAALLPGEEGIMVREEPLVFTVPFTTNWESLSPADADAILAEGHSLVRVIPWSAMTPDNKALRVDGRHPTDPDYPYREAWSLTAAPGKKDAVAALAPALTAMLAPLPTIRLAAVGDLNIARTQAEIITTTGDLAYPLSLVAPVFAAADYTIGNLESALGDGPRAIGDAPAAGQHRLDQRMMLEALEFAIGVEIGIVVVEVAQSLAIGGVDLVSLANNHALDYGPEALLQGIDLLHEAGVATVGGGADDAAAHAPYIADINGLKVAFLGYVHVPVEAITHFDTQSWTAAAGTPGLAWADPERIRADVAAVRPLADLVVVQLHSGYEYIEEPSEEQVAAARAAVDAGADLVVGHHAHILQGIHRYNDGVIAYGLGNFLFNIDGPPETAILNVWLDRDGVRQLEVIPAIVQQYGQPRLADFSEAGPILSRVYYLTTILNAANP